MASQDRIGKTLRQDRGKTKVGSVLLRSSGKTGGRRKQDRGKSFTKTFRQDRGETEARQSKEFY